MAVLGRLKIAPNQRLDLPDVIAFDAYSAGDWKGFFQAMVGDKSYIIKGFEAFQPQALIGNPASTVDVVVDESILWWPEADAGSFFVALPGAENQPVTLITDAANYIELSLTLGSRAEDARALWDPGANGGAGGEFTQVVDTESFLDVTVTRNNTGFSDDKIPIMKVVVNSSNNVVSITDCRPLYYRLGTGGATPDPLNSFAWEDDPLGYSRVDTPTTMSSSLDPNIFRGADKNIKTEKEWKDAVMSRIKELDGGAKWFQASGSSSLSLTTLFLDSQAGHSYQPDRGVQLAWSKANDGKLRSENTTGYTAPIRWKANFGQLAWALGGSFTSVTNRAFSTTTFEKSIADGENLYLLLVRDAAINGDPSIHWENLSGVTASASSSSSGSFSGVACGDFIRKESGSTFQYYRVVELRVNSGTPFPSGTVDGTVADATVQYLIVSTHDGPIATSDERYRYFRSQYQTADLVASTYGFYNTNYYWIGRRFGSMFYFRDYGDLQPGEETEVVDDSSTHEHGGSNGADLLLERAYNSIYDPSTGYKLATGSGTLLTLRRRLLDNTVGTPSSINNSGALLEYTIASAVGLMNDGDGLWVRLSNTTSGALSSGDVTNVATDNVWDIRDPSDTPLRSYDNRNVFLVARKFTIGPVEALIFADGTMMSFDGQWINNHLSVEGELYLKLKTQWSVPFIGTTGGRVDENNAEFFWNNTGGTDSLGVLGVRNLRITQDTVNGRDVIDQDVQQDHYFLPNLGAFTVRIGGPDSTVYIPGDIIVDGTSSSLSTQTLQVDDKLITLGIGTPLDSAYGAGFEIADDTKSASDLDSFNTQTYVDITYSSAHGYTIGDVLSVDSNADVGGITAGEINSQYTVVVTGTTQGDAEVMSATVVRVWTNGTATSTDTVSLSPPTTQVRTCKMPWSIRLGTSAAAYTGITSWVFRVKGVSTAPTLTPFSGYGIVPTAHSSNMQATRIAFVNDDNVGPAGADTTLNFSANLTWNSGTSTLTVGGDIVPMTDNTYDLGKYNLRWKTLHVGPGSVVVHGDSTDTLKVQLRYSGSYGILDTDAASLLQITTGANNGIRIDTSGRTSIGASGTDASTFLYLNTNNTALMTGTVQRGIYVNPTFSGTSSATAVKIAPDLQASLSVSDVYNLLIALPTSSGSVTITNHHGIYIEDMTTATVSKAINSQVTAATDRWFLYGAGNAISYLAGNLSIGNSTQATINSQRLLIGTSSDTTASGGLSFGGDNPMFRVAANTMKVGAHWIPEADNAYDLGTAALRWRNAFFSGSVAYTGGQLWHYGTVQTTNYTVLASDMVVPIDTSANVADITITLPAISAGNKGQVYILKDVGGQCSVTNKRIIIDGAGSNTIDDALTLTMENDYVSFTLISDGVSNWDVI